MSDLYQSIPPERRAEYTARAEAAFNEETSEVVDHIITDMAELVVSDAVTILQTSARETPIADQAQQYLKDSTAVSDQDDRFMQANDAANRRAVGEFEGMSFLEVYTRLHSESARNKSQKIDDDFSRRYRAHKSSSDDSENQ